MFQPTAMPTPMPPMRSMGRERRRVPLLGGRAYAFPRVGDRHCRTDSKRDEIPRLVGLPAAPGPCRGPLSVRSRAGQQRAGLQCHRFQRRRRDHRRRSAPPSARCARLVPVRGRPGVVHQRGRARLQLRAVLRPAAPVPVGRRCHLPRRLPVAHRRAPAADQTSQARRRLGEPHRLARDRDRDRAPLLDLPHGALRPRRIPLRAGEAHRDRLPADGPALALGGRAPRVRRRKPHQSHLPDRRVDLSCSSPPTGRTAGCSSTPATGRAACSTEAGSCSTSSSARPRSTRRWPSQPNRRRHGFGSPAPGSPSSAVATFVAPVTGLLGQTTTSDRVVIARLRDRPLQPRLAADGRSRSAARSGGRPRTGSRGDDGAAPRARPAQGPVRRDRLPRAAHAADLDPRLSRARPRPSCRIDSTDEQRQFLSVVVRNTDRLRRLVDDLLLVSEIDAGNLELDLTTSTWAPSRRRASSPRARRPRPAASASRSRRSGRVVSRATRCGSASFSTTSISNALKFTRAAAASPSGRAARTAPRWSKSKTRGSGSPLDEQAQLFDRFFRARAAARGRRCREPASGSRSPRTSRTRTAGSSRSRARLDVGTTFRVALPASG